MTPHTFHLLSISPSSEPSIISALWSHNPKALTVAKAHFFVSSSHLSSTLTNSPTTKSSPFNLVTILPGTSTALPPSIVSLTTKTWSFIADIEDQWTQDYATRNASLLQPSSLPIPALPSKPDTPPNAEEEEVEFPLTPELRKFLADFSGEYAGPVTMFNLLSFHDGMFPQYQLYMDGFVEVLGPKYGAQPRLLGPLVKDAEESGDEDKPWDMVGWIHYPGAASFGRMLDDEAYKVLDRKYKKGVVRDNPILLIVELEEWSGGES